MRVTGLHSPKPGGSGESFTARGVPAGIHYFAIRAIDDVMQQSKLSNVASITSPKCRRYLPLARKP